MKKITYISAALLLVITSCSTDVNLHKLADRIDNIEYGDVANNMESIAKLKKDIGIMEKDLIDYIDELEKQKLESLRSEIDQLKDDYTQIDQKANSLISSYDNSQNATESWLSQHFARKSDTESLLATIQQMKNTTLVELEKKMGEASDKAKDLLDACKSVLDKDIENVQNDIKDLIDMEDNLANSLQMLVNQIQSVVVVPDYNDGSVRLNADNKVVKFELFPGTISSLLVSNATSDTFSIKAVKTDVKSSVQEIDIPVTAFAEDGSFVALTLEQTALPAAYLSGAQQYNARLVITDSKSGTSISSNFFNLVP